MPVSRSFMWGVVLVSGVLFAGSTAELARRAAEFNRSAHLVRYHAETKQDREFSLGVYPTVKLSDAVDDKGRATLKLEFGGHTRLIPVKAPAAKDLPTLAAYEEWVAVLAMNEVGLDAQHRSAAVPGTDRLLVVVRRTPEGFDPETWGSVRRTEWVFDLYDLKPDGSITITTRRWPRPDLREQDFQKQAAASTDPGMRALAAIPPLEERTPEYFAAMYVIPKLNVPAHKFNDTALNFRVLSWTLPVSMLSGLVLIPALFFAIVTPRRKR